VISRSSIARPLRVAASTTGRQAVPGGSQGCTAAMSSLCASATPAPAPRVRARRTRRH